MNRDSFPRYSLFSCSNSRRQFLQYLIGSATGAVTLGFLLPSKTQAVDSTLEELCAEFPLNSRCENYLPGVQAKDMAGKPISANTLLMSGKVGEPLPVKGLPVPDVDYLVITEGPKIAPYGIKPVCTHLGCTVEWKAAQNRFVCPCHGSQYDSQGRVVHGPAAKDLPLITVVVKQGQVRLVDRFPAIDPRHGAKQS
ncbi:MAG: Rieske 2Fe-2S domain-containing protein [Leptolyngbyaceae cyanobacterium]